MALREETHYGPTTGKCSLCGETPVAYWVGKVGTVEICRTCAQEELPGLLADALGSDEHSRRQMGFDNTLDRFLKNFWKFATKLVSRKDRPDDVA